MENIHEQKDKLKRKISITQSARFEASRRQQGKHIASSLTQLLLSCFIFTLSILQCFNFLEYELLEKHGNHIQFVSIVVSAFILIFSTWETHQDYKFKEDKFHTFALSLGKFLNQLEDPDKEVNLSKIREEYQQELEIFSLNHAPIDYEIAKHDYDYWGNKNWYSCICKKGLEIRYVIFTFLPYFIFLSVPLLITCWLIFD
jgi:hypothetical protein